MRKTRAMNKDLLEFLEKRHPEALEQYKRLTTPNYWECGVIYNPQVSGFGFGCSGKSNKKLMFKNATVYKHEKYFSFYDIDKPTEQYTCEESNAFYSLKRFDENVVYNDNIINDGIVSYLTVKGIEFIIRQTYWKTYAQNRVGFSISVSSNKSDVTYNYYNRIGKAEPVFKTCRPIKNLGVNEDYDIEFKVSVRKFKENVFGDPNIKIPSTKGKMVQLTKNQVRSLTG